MKKKTPIQWLMLLIMTLGVAAILYPLGSELYQRYNQQQVIAKYQKESKKIDAHLQDEDKKRAAQYNQKIKERVSPKIKDPFASDAQADQEGSYDLYAGLLGKTIGVIRIPKIDVDLPIYFGTNDEQLEKGAGVIPGTSLPTGGKGTHSVVTAHRGLRNSRLFTDLPELKIGDQFFVDQGKTTLAYQVDQIVTVKPDQVEYLKVTPDKDYVTLLTCTPLGVNTHRLLVRGHRVPYEKQNETVKTGDQVKQASRTYQPLLIVTGLIILLLLISWLIKKFTKKSTN